MKFNLFISYSTDPDHQLALSLEGFLEGLHSIKTSGNIRLPRLEICLDASDFSQLANELPKNTDELIFENLLKSNELLILCSSHAMESEWVHKEVEWFIQNRGIQKVRIGITDPVMKRDYQFNKWFIDHSFQEKSWYDFRQFRMKKTQVEDTRDLENEKLRLAADLIGIKTSDIQPIWFKEKLKNAKKLYSIVLISITIIFTSIVFSLLHNENQRVKRNLESMIVSGNDIDFLNGVYFLSKGVLPKELEQIWITKKKYSPDQIWQLIKSRENNSVKCESFMKGWYQFLQNVKDPNILSNIIEYILESVDEKQSIGVLAASLDLAYWDHQNSEVYFNTRLALQKRLFELIGKNQIEIKKISEQLEWIKVEKRTFLMGCDIKLEGLPEEQNEIPLHLVTVNEFEMLSHEVTRKLYRYFNENIEAPSEVPISEVSWFEAYTVALFYGARLPTEAEWELACRGQYDKRSRFFSGNEENILNEIGWYRDNSFNKLQPVKTKKPNNMGFYDMHGNVYEWCLDYFSDYENISQINYYGANNGKTKVQRGGAYKSEAKFCSSSNRGKLEPHRELKDVGFRIVRVNNKIKP
ncbi:formylglycine-generating enzyme family protein [Aquimarina litoralis]|uniref:formylglycine-generating enzyme family protein n=1 Tax=Aquimarina litoralis TaxID=584605 RepID=UPI001C58F30E|nr:formylglycine-generating enzyme family protein [Aquimarina litoralis]MBW1298116.1 SUMF1/EgtB/PvdO family nonheme iron enzyme [Aquimarina litoralis]